MTCSLSQRMALSSPLRAATTTRSPLMAAANDAARRFCAAHSGASVSHTSTRCPVAPAASFSRASAASRAAAVFEIVEDDHQVDVAVGVGVAPRDGPERQHLPGAGTCQGPAGCAGVVDGRGRHHVRNATAWRAGVSGGRSRLAGSMQAVVRLMLRRGQRGLPVAC